MQAIVVGESGCVERGDVDDPQPLAGHVVVEVAAFSINRGETYQIERQEPGWRPGKDLAGTVIQAAPDGSGPPVGARVVGHTNDAAWAERAAVPLSRVVELPDEVSFPTAAALPLAGLAALRLVRVVSPLPSRRILFTGAAGGVGHYFVELAAGQGALVTAVVRSTNHHQRLEELGAVEVIDDIEQSDGPFDVAIESVGGATTKAAWHKLEEHGMLLIGSLPELQVIQFGSASPGPPPHVNDGSGDGPHHRSSAE
jgi:NADPH:quinone reductase-like Zn-dependent oxidoreductase